MDKPNEPMEQCLRFAHHEGLYYSGALYLVEWPPTTLQSAPIRITFTFSTAITIRVSFLTYGTILFQSTIQFFKLHNNSWTNSTTTGQRQDHNDAIPTGNDPVPLLCMHSSDSHTHDTHIPRLYPIEASSDIGASDIFKSSQSDDTPPVPTEHDDWTLDIGLRQRSMDSNYMHDIKRWRLQINRSKYTFFQNKIWLDDRIVVPTSRIHEIIEHNHNGILQGHWGGAKTAQFLRCEYIIPNVNHHVQQHVLTCPDSQLFKHTNIANMDYWHNSSYQNFDGTQLAWTGCHSNVIPRQ